MPPSSPTRRGALALPAAALAGGVAAPPPARSQPSAPADALPVEVLARFPPGTFLENLAVEPSGRVLFTNYTARRVEAWTRGGGHATHAAVEDAHPVAVAALPDGGHALTVHGVAFTEGAAAMRGAGAVLLLGPDGAARGRVALPEAVFPNGILLLPGGMLLVADSGSPRLWAVQPAAGVAQVWYEHPALGPDPARPGLPGANGLKVSADRRSLLVTHSAARALLAIPFKGARAGGEPVRVAGFPGGVDDAAVAADGTIYAATHGAPGLARLAPRATEAAPMAAPESLDGATAVALAPDGRSLYALGTGGLAAAARAGRAPGEAVLARVSLG